MNTPNEDELIQALHDIAADHTTGLYYDQIKIILQAAALLNTLRDLRAQNKAQRGLLERANAALNEYTTPGHLGGRIPINQSLVTAITKHLEETK